MKRGGELKRTGGLVRRTALKAKKSLTSKPRARVVDGGDGAGPSTKRPRYTGPDQATRTKVGDRDGWACVMCGTPGVHELQHRTSRSMGGSDDPAINSPANLITLCRRDHQWVEANPQTAQGLGYSVRRPTCPATVPVLVHPGSFFLHDHDGGRVPAETTKPQGASK